MPGLPPPPSFHDSPTRRRIGTFFRFFLPITGTSILVYGFTHPDQDPLVPARMVPELQWLATQQAPNTQPFSNWSGTHEATPR